VTVIEDRTHIEIAKLSDAAEIAVMSKNNIEYGLAWKYTPERITKLIRDSSTNVVVARRESELVGFGIMTYHEFQANLDLLGVKQDFRRMKIGTQIIQWLEKVALTAGIFNIFVQVRAKNVGAIKFYQTSGFTVLVEKKSYYQGVETGIIMSKNIRRMFNAIK